MSRHHRDKLPDKVITILDRYKVRMNKQIEGHQRSIDIINHRLDTDEERDSETLIGWVADLGKKIQHNVKVLKLIEELQELLRK